MRPRAINLWPLAAGVIAAVACLSSGGCYFLERGDGLDPAKIPEDERTDYAIFAQRCSKCHSLARPLNSGITTDTYWRIYVERMRRQPASGISEADTVPILRFLHWYSEEQKREATR